jgi:hypothetical protein
LTIVGQSGSIILRAGSVTLGWLLIFSRVQAMKTRLEKLIDEKRSLKTQLVQIESMLFTIDFYISEELLQQAEVKDEPDEG